MKELILFHLRIADRNETFEECELFQWFDITPAIHNVIQYLEMRVFCYSDRGLNMRQPIYMISIKSHKTHHGNGKAGLSWAQLGSVLFFHNVIQSMPRRH